MLRSWYAPSESSHEKNVSFVDDPLTLPVLSAHVSCAAEGRMDRDAIQRAPHERCGKH